MSDRIRLYTDEDVTWRLAEALTARGFDVLSCHEAGNAGLGLSDDWQLTFAAQAGRVLLSYNGRHYVPLATRWSLIGKTHHGIIVARRMSFRLMIERVSHHLNTHSAESHHDVLMYLS